MRKNIFLGLMLLISLGLNAQIYKTGNQQLIEDAIQDGIVIWRQSYQLEDTAMNQRFGRYGEAEFGKSYSLAVKVGGGLYLFGQAMRPWESDGNFARYRETHKPVLYKTYYRCLSDSVEHEIVIDYARAEGCGENNLFFLRDSTTFSGNGFTVDGSEGTKKGWLVWVTSDVKLEDCDSTTTADYVIYRHEQTIVADSLQYGITPPATGMSMWGGIYVVPEQTAIGQLTFRLCGIISKEGDGWQLIIPSKGTSQPEVSSSDTQDELTPVDDSADEKKSKKSKRRKRR